MFWVPQNQALLLTISVVTQPAPIFLAMSRGKKGSVPM
jgi:hypothetical protein